MQQAGLFRVSARGKSLRESYVDRERESIRCSSDFTLLYVVFLLVWCIHCYCEWWITPGKTASSKLNSLEHRRAAIVLRESYVEEARSFLAIKASSALCLAANLVVMTDCTAVSGLGWVSSWRIIEWFNRWRTPLLKSHCQSAFTHLVRTCGGFEAGGK